MTTKTNNQSALPSIDTLWNYSNPKETEAKFRNLIPKAKLRVDKTYYAELLTQLARTQSLQGNFEEAHAILDSAKEVITDKMVIPQIRYRLERGRTLNSSNKKVAASEQFILAYEMATINEQDYLAVDAAHMLGISEKLELQLDWSLKALELSEKSDDVRAQKRLGSLYNNIGWTFHDSEHYDKALGLFKKALAWRQKEKDKRGTFIAHWTIARTYRSLGRIDDALKIQLELLNVIEQRDSDPDGHVYEEIGECLLVKEEPKKAKNYFKLAHELLSKDRWLRNHAKERLERLEKMGSNCT